MGTGLRDSLPVTEFLQSVHSAYGAEFRAVNRILSLGDLLGLSAPDLESFKVLRYPSELQEGLQGPSALPSQSSQCSQ